MRCKGEVWGRGWEGRQGLWHLKHMGTRKDSPVCLVEEDHRRPKKALSNAFSSGMGGCQGGRGKIQGGTERFREGLRVSFSLAS